MNYNLNQDEIELLAAFRKLPQIEQWRIVGMVEERAERAERHQEEKRKYFTVVK